MDNDPVANPSHYQTESGVEAIDVIDAFFADNYYLGNVFKYLARAGKKDDKHQDLLKAQWYLNRYVDKFLEEDTDEEIQKGSGTKCAVVNLASGTLEDEWDYDKALSALYDAGYEFNGVPVLRSTRSPRFEYTLTPKGEWIDDDGWVFPFYSLFVRLENGSVEEVNPVWYALTEKGEVAARLSRAGFSVPVCKRLRIVKGSGWYADLLEDGTWLTSLGFTRDTDDIINLLNNCDTAKLVDADKEGND